MTRENQPTKQHGFILARQHKTARKTTDSRIDVRSMGIRPRPNYDGQGRPSFDMSTMFKDPTYKLNKNDAPREHTYKRSRYKNDVVRKAAARRLRGLY